jgi:type IV pilus assembly protein PilN
MARINLLPWREALRQEQQKTFINALALAVLLTCFAFGAVYQYIESQKSYQGRRNAFLEKKIEEVNKKIEEIQKIKDKRDKLENKIEVIEDLQASRSEIVHVFDELRKVTPEGIFLTDFNQQGDKLMLKGRLTANSEVSALMDAIVESEWITLDGSGLKKIDGREHSEKEANSQFIILAKQLKTKDKKKDTDIVEGQ